MARIKGELKHGLTVGKDSYRDFEIHDHLTAGQIIVAKEQAEKVVAFNDGARNVPVVVESPAKLGALILCQQIAQLGPLVGPLDVELFNKLHEDDLEILNLYADLAAGAIDRRQLTDALNTKALHASPEVTQRGRDPSVGDGAAEDGSQPLEEGANDNRHSSTQA